MANPVYLVAFSGGKDSVAMVLHLLEIGVPKEQIHLHHHEVDGNGPNLWDWNCTTSYCIALDLGVPGNGWAPTFYQTIKIYHHVSFDR